MNRRVFLGFLPGLFATAQKVQFDDFNLPDLDGNEVPLSRFAGKAILLDFWATWCQPCIAEIPNLNMLQAKYQSRGLQVLGVALESGLAGDIRRHPAVGKIEYPVLVGNDRIANSYDVFGFPTRFLITRDRRIHEKFTGSRPANSPAELDRQIQLLLEPGR
jgi:peroxiredoxin